MTEWRERASESSPFANDSISWPLGLYVCGEALRSPKVKSVNRWHSPGVAQPCTSIFGARTAECAIPGAAWPNLKLSMASMKGHGNTVLYNSGQPEQPAHSNSGGLLAAPCAFSWAPFSATPFGGHAGGGATGSGVQPYPLALQTQSRTPHLSPPQRHHPPNWAHLNAQNAHVAHCNLEHRLRAKRKKELEGFNSCDRLFVAHGLFRAVWSQPRTPDERKGATSAGPGTPRIQ